MHSGAQCTDVEWEGYEGLPVERFIYSELGRNSLVYGVFPTADIIADWIADACTQPEVLKTRKCSDILFDHIWSSNNAQFAISGIVVEPASIACFPPDTDPDVSWCGQTFTCGAGGTAKSTAINLPFRHGVTVRTQSMPTSDGAIYCQNLSISQIELIAKETVTSVKNYGRIANFHRGNNEGYDFLELNRLNLVNAYASGSDQFMRQIVVKNSTFISVLAH